MNILIVNHKYYLSILMIKKDKDLPIPIIFILFLLLN